MMEFCEACPNPIRCGKAQACHLSESLQDPQLTPSDHCYIVLQDFGSQGGGWGPAAWTILGTGDQPQPVVYTGNSDAAITYLFMIAKLLNEKTGKPTKVCVYRQRTDLASYE